MKRLFVLVMIFGFATAAHAGYDFGNGGMGVFCTKASPETATLLDVFEGARRGLTYRHLRSLRSLTVDQAFDRILRTHLRRAPDISNLFSAWSSRRADEIEFARGPVESLRNPGSIANLGDCRRIQIAAQWIHFPLSLKAPQKILIDRAPWSLLPSDQRAALLFHEYMIRWGHVAGAGCVRDVIGQVAYLLSDRALSDEDARWFQAFAVPSFSSCGFDADRDTNSPH